MRSSKSRSKLSGMASHLRLAVYLPGIALALALGACSSETNQSNANVASSDKTAGQGVAGLSLGGLGDLRIGQAAPKGGTWAERGAQASDTCRTVSSPKYRGVYAIVTDGEVQRITIGQRSDVAVDGLRIGASEQEVKKRFAGLVDEPHKYEDKPAKYLTSADASNGKPAFRFEIGNDGKVKLIHAGVMPVLAYVEGCA